MFLKELSGWCVENYRKCKSGNWENCEETVGRGKRQKMMWLNPGHSRGGGARWAYIADRFESLTGKFM